MSDGEVAIYTDQWCTYEIDENYEHGFDGEFSWSEGNFSCDCNRRDFFADARNEPRPEDSPCGDVAFTVRIEDAETGTILYKDDDYSDETEGSKE